MTISFKKKQLQFKMDGTSRKDFLNAFDQPFSFYKYTFLKEEWPFNTTTELLEIEKEFMTVYTNDSTLPQYRLLEEYIDNLFDAYHRWLQT